MDDQNQRRTSDPFLDAPERRRPLGFFESANLAGRLQYDRLFVDRKLLRAIADLSESDFWVIIELDRIANRNVKRQVIAFLLIVCGSVYLQRWLIDAYEQRTGVKVWSALASLPILTFALLLACIYILFWTARYAGGRISFQLISILRILRPPTGRWRHRRDRWFRPSILERDALRTNTLRRRIDNAAVQIAYDTALLNGHSRADSRRYGNDSASRMLQHLARDPLNPTSRLALLMLVLLLARQVACNQAPQITTGVDYLPVLRVRFSSKVSNTLKNPILLGLCVPFAVLALDKAVDVIAK